MPLFGLLCFCRVHYHYSCHHSLHHYSSQIVDFWHIVCGIVELLRYLGLWTGLWIGRQRNFCSICGKGKWLTLLESIGVSCGALPASCSVHTRGTFWGVKWPGHETDHFTCLVPTMRMNGAILASSYFLLWCVWGWLYSTAFFGSNRTKDVNVPEVLCCVNTVILFCHILMNISLAEMLNTERKHEKVKLNWN